MGIILIFILSHYTSLLFGNFFCGIFSSPNCIGGLWNTSNYLAGIAPAFIFLSTLFFSFLNKKWDYVILGILLILPLAYLIFFDPGFVSHLWFYVITGIVAFGLVFGARKLSSRT